VLADINVMQIVPWIALILVIAGAIMVRYGLRQLVVRPLRDLETVSTRQASGEIHARAKIQHQDEIGRLAQVLNTNADVIEQRNAELQRSNIDLEQFAYVASHDLQEPLRMISSYTQLLEKRYRGKLDERADQYIHFAVDGANRMQNLIEDLLAFSRLGTRQGRIEQVSSQAVVEDVLHTLDSRIKEANAEVVVGELPTMYADKSQIGQVFQNLIGNALKFRREGVKHRVEVSAMKIDGFYQFVVLDNGIGIAPEFFERIFTIFQRLHSREAYSGSGIGLSIVKRIVERHGGRVWLESLPSQGTAFYFTFPIKSPTKDAHEPKHD
jgi:light-regulated signal transduction histidine kinase (bacteriophytochrome)